MHRAYTPRDSHALNYDLVSRPAVLDALKAAAAIGITGPQLWVVPKGTRVWRFSDEKSAVGGGGETDRMRWKLSPWWFPDSTYQAIVAHAAHYFHVEQAQVTPFQFASTARKDLAVWFNWNDMNVLMGATLKEDTIVLGGEGGRIPLQEQFVGKADAEKYQALRVSAILPRIGALQFHVPGIGYSKHPLLDLPATVREERYWSMFGQTFTARLSAPVNRAKLGLPANFRTG
jgi:hypothetical protein